MVAGLLGESELHHEVSAVILAGGRGERIGGEKAALRLGGETLLERAEKLVSHLSDDVVVVVRADQSLEVRGARVVPDATPDGGVLAAITAGVTAADHEWSLVVACDMPFLNLALLEHMISLRGGYDAVVPRLRLGCEPLHALYHRRCLSGMWRALALGRRRAISFLEGSKVRYVESDEIAPFDADGRSFFNINTPRDLAVARAWLKQVPGRS